jgi:hypothetical protein
MDAGIHPVVSPDNRTLYAVANPRNERRSIVALEIDAGARIDFSTAREKARFPLAIPLTIAIETMTLSPDGRTIAIWTDHGLWGVNVDGSGLKELYPADPPDWGTRPVWTKDGRAILIGVRDDYRKWQVLRVPADGGKSTFTGLEVTDLEDFDLSPDGTRLVFDGISPTISNAR